MKEAMLYEKMDKNKVRCKLCNHRCTIPPDGKGICHVRVNENGTLYSLVYGKPISVSVDPIEKKPLFHFLPGTKSLSVATVGCNFRCDFCQNFDISQFPKEHPIEDAEDVPPENIVQSAVDRKCKSIAYTYTEPTVFFEYAYDIASLARKKGIKNVFVTNGYYTEEALEKIKPFLDAANIDFKGFSEEFYEKVVGAKMQYVIETIKRTCKAGIHIEITTLVIPGHNDSDDALKKIAEFIASLSTSIPWHLSRFHPSHKMSNVDVTPLETLEKAYGIGKKAGLKYVYIGNVHNNKHENTLCPECNKPVIERVGYKTENKLKADRCPFCDAKVDVVV